jgi:voltage-gated potassium channel
LLTLISVVLALLLYTEIDPSSTQAYTIYIFDLFVVAVLAFDFYVRTKVSDDRFRYAILHSYEIPAMIPLLIFAWFEDPLILGAAVRSLRFIRLFRLIRLANLIRIAEHWRVSTFVYLVIISAATIIFGAIAIFIVEENNENIKDFGDAVWLSVTTLTISGYGDVYPVTPQGRIIATVLSFVGLAIILGFISNVGSALIESRIANNQKRLSEETKSPIIDKNNNLERLDEDEFRELVSILTGLHQQGKTIRNSDSMCSSCKNKLPVESVYCNKCGQKV